MSSKSSIEWTDATWNPVTGCTKVSQGCKNCYAETWANRKMGEFSKEKNRGFTDIICHEDKLDIPLKWIKPKKIFVNSMSDLFHEKVPFEFILKVFKVMQECKQHTFQILTKRPERMKEFMNEYFSTKDYMGNPNPNVWLGVSVEDQKTANERIPILLQIPAQVRWISAEPLLGEIDINSSMRKQKGYADLDWAVVGGESGPKARPMNPDWVFKIRDDCKAAGVPFFFKQWGEYEPYKLYGVWQYHRSGKKKAGRSLCNEYYDEMPEVYKPSAAEELT